MVHNRNVIIKLSEKLEKMAPIIAGSSKSAITWGEVQLPVDLREEVERTQKTQNVR